MKFPPARVKSKVILILMALAFPLTILSWLFPPFVILSLPASVALLVAGTYNLYAINGQRKARYHHIRVAELEQEVLDTPLEKYLDFCPVCSARDWVGVTTTAGVTCKHCGVWTSHQVLRDVQAKKDLDMWRDIAR